MKRRFSGDSGRFRGELTALTAAVDAAIASAEAAGIPGLRVIKKDGGFQLEQAAVLCNGGWRWEKVTWGSNRGVIERAMRCRGWSATDVTWEGK